MATNYTENYQLPLWAADDSFLRTEFNDANQKIDGAIKAVENKIYMGMFLGDGTYGVNHPTTFTFPFQPRAVYLGWMGKAAYPGGWFRYGSTSEYVQYSYSDAETAIFSWNGNTLSVYSKAAAEAQFNADGVYTIYIALA